MGGAAAHARLRLGHLDNDAHADPVADRNRDAAMIRRAAAIVLIITVLASACVPAPTPIPTPQTVLGGQRLSFPLVMAAPYRWQRTGYGRPTQTTTSDRMLKHQGMWSYTWGMRCDSGYIPMVFSGNDLPSVDALDRCAASTVLLVFNEPEYASQANTTPAQGARAIKWIEDHWDGELWCCGNLASHPGWLNAMLSLYKAEYGDLPALAGIHLHIYVADGFKIDAPAPDDSSWLKRSQTELARYREVVARWGLPQRFVVSECCALHGDAMTRVMDGYMQWLRSEPGVESVAWFSSRYGGFPDPNLLKAGGALTELGEAWLGWRWK